jgi:hypothetical protein
VSSPIVSMSRRRRRGDAVNAESAMPSSASMPSAPIALREQDRRLVDEIGGHERGRNPRPALDQEPGDSPAGEETQRRGEVDAAIRSRATQHFDTLRPQRLAGRPTTEGGGRIA